MNSSAEILRSILEEKTKKNPAYSLRAAARDLEVSHGYLSLIMAGKKRVSFQRALKICQALGVDEARSQLLLRSVALEATKDSACREFLAKSIGNADSQTQHEFALLELDRFKAISEWFHVALLDLTAVEGFKADSAWIASKLGISEQQAKSAGERLERLGLLEKTKAGWRKTSTRLAVPTNYSERAVREFHSQMMDKAREALQRPSAEDFAKRDISGSTMTIDPDLLPEVKKRIEAFRRQLIAFAASSKPKSLYQLNVQFFSLLEDQSKKGTKTK